MLRGLACGRLSFCNNLLPMAELKTRILVVDDDQRHRDLLVRYLGGEGYEVKAVPDAPWATMTAGTCSLMRLLACS